MLGLDYASSSPGSTAVKDAGYGFVARYLSRYTAKVIKKPEYDDMTNDGVGVVLVFEDYANQALQGYNQGVVDAQFALGQANALGWPEDRPIHFAVDFDISDAQKPVAGQYMLGAISVLGLARTGAYGGYWWIKYCVDNKLSAPNANWQAVAWSGGNIHPNATMFQRLGGTTVNGTECDVNEALKSDFGQNNKQGEDVSKVDLSIGRILAYFVLGRVDPVNDALAGKSDGDISENHTGVETNNEIQEFYDSNEGKNWRNRIVNLLNLETQVPALQKQADDAQAARTAAEKAAADAKAAQKRAENALAVLQAQTIQDTATGNSFIRWIGKLFGKG